MTFSPLGGGGFAHTKESLLEFRIFRNSNLFYIYLIYDSVSLPTPKQMMQTHV